MSKRRAIRKGNNRRRARELKQGGLYTLQHHPRILSVGWSESEESPVSALDRWRKTVLTDA